MIQVMNVLMGSPDFSKYGTMNGLVGELQKENRCTVEGGKNIMHLDQWKAI